MKLASQMLPSPYANTLAVQVPNSDAYCMCADCICNSASLTLLS